MQQCETAGMPAVRLDWYAIKTGLHVGGVLVSLFDLAGFGSGFGFLRASFWGWRILEVH